MRDKDHFLLEQAYGLVHESAKPCPCIKKDGKCTKKNCECKRCLAHKKKAKKNLDESSLTTEDAQDAPQDAALERSIKEILLGAIRREELNEYSLERGPIVSEIMSAVQRHIGGQSASQAPETFQSPDEL